VDLTRRGERVSNRLSATILFDQVTNRIMMVSSRCKEEETSTLDN